MIDIKKLYEEEIGIGFNEHEYIYWLELKLIEVMAERDIWKEFYKKFDILGKNIEKL